MLAVRWAVAGMEWARDAIRLAWVPFLATWRVADLVRSGVRWAPGVRRHPGRVARQVTVRAGGVGWSETRGPAPGQARTACRGAARVGQARAGIRWAPGRVGTPGRRAGTAARRVAGGGRRPAGARKRPVLSPRRGLGAGMCTAIRPPGRAGAVPGRAAVVSTRGRAEPAESRDLTRSGAWAPSAPGRGVRRSQGIGRPACAGTAEPTRRPVRTGAAVRTYRTATPARATRTTRRGAAPVVACWPGWVARRARAAGVAAAGAAGTAAVTGTART